MVEAIIKQFKDDNNDQDAYVELNNLTEKCSMIKFMAKELAKKILDEYLDYKCNRNIQNTTKNIVDKYRTRWSRILLMCVNEDCREITQDEEYLLETFQFEKIIPNLISIEYNKEQYQMCYPKAN